MNRTAVAALIEKHEGRKLRAYKDSVGKTTIGIGRNLDDRGISDAECNAMFERDLTEIIQGCVERVPSFRILDDVRQHVLIDMAFNMGIEGLLRFHKMFAALEARKFDVAADEMRDSKWYGQVGVRGRELESMMRNGA